MFIEFWPFFRWVHDLFLILILLGVLYLIILTIAARWTESISRRKEWQITQLSGYQHRFLLIIPAHNEESSIEHTLQSLKALEYPKGRFQMVVISDNSVDATTHISRMAGARVIERTDPSRRGKGYALRFGFSELLKDPEWDACLIIDADSVVDSGTLRVLNHYLNGQGEVFQMNDQIVPRTDSWSSESTRLGFFLYNYIRPLGKQTLGFPVGLRGNGMCFRRSVIERHPWQAFSLAEDLEFGLHLISEGIDPFFVPESTVLAKMPTHSKDAMSQRRRWEMGRWPLFRRYTFKLLARRGFRSLETLLDLFIPPLVHYAMFIVIGWGVWASAKWGIGVSISHFAFAGWIWFFAFSLLLVHLFLALSSDRADHELKRAVRFAPTYVLWKVRVYLQMLVKGREKEWIRTTRR